MKSNSKIANDWTRAELERLPYREWNEELVCDSLIIMPTSRLHDSGYRAMEFVAVVAGVPTKRMSGCSDVIHFDGIGGYGWNWMSRGVGGMSQLVEPKAWSVDCLATSGLLQIFAHGFKLVCGLSLSSFELFAVRPSSETKGELQ